MKRSEFIEEFRRKAPGPVISRPTLAIMSGGLKCVGHIANRDSLNTGPSGRVKMGRRVGYETVAAGIWLADELGLVD
ncbi:hypothetical protein KAI46_14580 [bacterium]|nr:hypothetical protein [bacterium]